MARGSPSPSLSALLHVGLDELLGVLLEHRVDLVEDLVHLLLELLALGGRLGLFGVGALLGRLLLGLLPFLLLRHIGSFARVVRASILASARAEAPLKLHYFSQS